VQKREILKEGYSSIGLEIFSFGWCVLAWVQVKQDQRNCKENFFEWFSRKKVKEMNGD
jgi:hypothetical protein